MHTGFNLCYTVFQMQKLPFLILFLLISTFMFSSCSLIAKQPSPQPTTAPSTSASATPVTLELGDEPSLQPTDFTARFEIFTNGTKRIFTDAKYHNQSNDVYIEKLNPQLIFIKQAGVTWSDFFSTLPFSITKDCLVTGTKQTFCTTETKKLYFYLNDQENPDVLDTIIAPNDSLRVEYRSYPF